MSERLPHEVLRDIESIVKELRALGAEYGGARQQLVAAEWKYEKAVSAGVIAIYEQAKVSGERLPAEDVRRAIVHKHIDDEVWSNYLVLKAKIDAMDRILRIHQSALSGLQSELSMMRAELRTVGDGLS